MKKLVALIPILIMVGCHKNAPTISLDSANNTIIEDVIKSYADDILTPEEAAHWDSMNAEGGYMLVRGAERYLDTVVNHLHIIFITEK